jgi:CheY-like chemotaxis protein
VPAHIAVFNHSENLLFLFKSLLSQYGYEVSTHLQSLEGIETARALMPDLIIFGYFKGFVENELEIIEALRADPHIGHIPVLVCTTGPVRTESQSSGKPVPYVTVIEKPFDAKDLVMAVRQALKQAVRT